ncbi:MAG TPA: WecB/TagA/CpsF family glycosyltransferase [Flavobacteriales bacterium]|nr:WecB/TagA/CpsF family glycosyltransferase [Flavobacteriales bacterium]
MGPSIQNDSSRTMLSTDHNEGKALPVLPKRRVLTVDISIGSFDEQIAIMAAYGAAHRSSYVCCVNAHMTVEARDPVFAHVVNSADLATPDGMPVLRVLQLNNVQQERVAGNDVLPALFGKAAVLGLSIYLMGATEDVQQRIVDRAAHELPDLRIAGRSTPPFTAFEDMDLDGEAERINASGAHIVMVSLGCPKQERWMAAMKGRVNAIMLGVGGAFLLYARIDKRAPKWMRDLSLEWAYRLALEPRRLFKRYFVTNSIFLVLVFREMIWRSFGWMKNTPGAG